MPALLTAAAFPVRGLSVLPMPTRLRLKWPLKKTPALTGVALLSATHTKEDLDYGIKTFTKVECQLGIIK